MSTTCPNGHASATADYCDQCGAPIATQQVEAASSSSAEEELETSPAARRQPCPQCGAARTGDDRYCEGCGYDFAGPAPAALSVATPGSKGADGAVAAGWEAVAGASREQFDKLAPAGLEFPSDYPERRFPLTAAEVKIGRSHPPAQAPEINLAGKSEDPGVSHLHAVLERQPDGSYALRDLGSTNGTTINDDSAAISGEVAAPLADGDRIHLGAWTMITLHKT